MAVCTCNGNQYCEALTNPPSCKCKAGWSGTDCQTGTLVWVEVCVRVSVRMRMCVCVSVCECVCVCVASDRSLPQRRRIKRVPETAHRSARAITQPAFAPAFRNKVRHPLRPLTHTHNTHSHTHFARSLNQAAWIARFRCAHNHAAYAAPVSQTTLAFATPAISELIARSVRS